jgi:sulfur-oxidizing protein SoxX
MRYHAAIAVSLSVIVLSSCDYITERRGFSLPEGNLKSGEVVFTTLKCNSCHSLPTIEQLPDVNGHEISVKLGGDVTRIKTYEELVTAIINPSHRITQPTMPQNLDADNQSAMRNYNDIMTVSQLIDLVSFLQTQYTLLAYEPTRYQMYGP